MNVEDYGGGVSVAQTVGDRATQQDDFGCLVAEEFTFVIIADGMGGHEAGEEASEIVVEKFLGSITHLDKGYSLSQFQLATSLANANEEIATVIENQPDKAGMGSTVVVFYIDGNSMQWLSVGDSHVYRFRRNRLTKLNADHSMKPMILELAESGSIDASDVDSHPLRNTLRSAITGQTIDLIDYPPEPLKVKKGDIYLLCSDGLDVLDHAAIEATIKRRKKFESSTICDELLKAALNTPTTERDNTTLAVVKVCHGHRAGLSFPLNVVFYKYTGELS
ncbi:MAG: protein phosphatase 2C domain-containing protein [Arenicella sp.]|nr:protein phosphatase 2C domain-containing protein [Arenicella sp.]